MTFSAVLLASALIFGISSCSNDDDSTDQSPKGTESVSTTGTVTAATTNTSGQKTATLQASNGSYLFTETNPGVSANISYRAVVDESKGGTWTFTEKNAATAKYSGTYKGDISKFGNSEVKLSLTVEKILSNGKLTDVASQKSFDFEATATEFKATVPAVEVKASSNSGKTEGGSSATTPTVTLPESVGTNPFSGKTFTVEGSSSEKMRTWTFTNDAATETYTRIKNNETKTENSIYRYSYDSNQNLLFLSFKSFSGENRGITYSFSSLEEYEEVLRMYSGLSEVELESELAVCANQFATMVVYKYEISGSSISLIDYFYGTLPTTASFRTSDNKISLKKGEGIWLWPEGSTGNGDGYHRIAPVYNDGTFTGKLSYNNEIIGSIEGTYTTSGKGTSGCSITLTFTKLPESVTGITTGTEYVLTN